MIQNVHVYFVFVFFMYTVFCMQWKIRRVLAFSLHELARVLGTEQTCSDILPIFEDYSTKDCDDVKIGTLTHLTEFFEVSKRS